MDTLRQMLEERETTRLEILRLQVKMRGYQEDIAHALVHDEDTAYYSINYAKLNASYGIHRTKG